MKMRTWVTPLVLTILTFVGSSQSWSLNVGFYVDSAPNVYGSPNWAAWWTSTQQDVKDGAMQNMRTGLFPGTLCTDPLDFIVYSTGDLGKRVHWIYWIPNMSVSQMSGLFQVRNILDWGGTDYTYDYGTASYVDLSVDPDAGWIQPGSWTDYMGGVIGSFGWAWWATDNDALPNSTDGNPYNETDSDDIMALRNLVLSSQTYLGGQIRYRDSITDEWTTEDLTLQVKAVPEPSTLALVGAGVAAMVGRRKRIL